MQSGQIVEIILVRVKTLLGKLKLDGLIFVMILRVSCGFAEVFRITRAKTTLDTLFNSKIN